MTAPEELWTYCHEALPDGYGLDYDTAWHVNGETFVAWATWLNAWYIRGYLANEKPYAWRRVVQPEPPPLTAEARVYLETRS